MYEIDKNTLCETSAKQFCNQVFKKNPKPALFWDTCALLNIIRFIYREIPGDATTYDAIKAIYEAITNDSIYSLSCVSVVSEFNNNVDKTVNETSDSVYATYNYYKNIVETTNRLDGTSNGHFDITTCNMPLKLYSMVADIINKTKFISIDKTSTANAHQRVLQGKAPAGKKEEFKDCTIWEVMLSCCRQINTVDVNIPKCFYTVNTEDFCYIVNKAPRSFLHDLVLESTALSFKCCKNVFEVVTALGI